jgi:small-conductance mechanosensitive channel
MDMVAVAGALPKRVREALKPFQAFEWEDLLWSVGIGVAGLVIGRIVAALVTRALERWARLTDNPVDDAVVRHLSRPIRWLLPILGLQLALPLLSMPDSAENVLQHILLISSIIGLGWALHGVVRVLEELIQRRFDVTLSNDVHARQVQTQFRGFRNIASFLIVLVTVAFVFLTFQRVRQLGAGMLASAGVAGVVIGFAAQRSLATVLAGIQIALSQPIRVGDSVTVENEFGTVEEITLTYVVIRIWDLRRLIVPIAYFIEKPFQNWTRASAEVLGTVLLHLDFTVPVEPIREELQRVLEQSPLWDRVKWALQVTDVTERTMTLRALVSARNASDAFELRCAVREQLLAFVQKRFPDSLPRIRSEQPLTPAG